MVDGVQVRSTDLGSPIDMNALCLAQYDTPAGAYTCGARIQWLVENSGFHVDTARRQVAGEFPQECGACLDLSRNFTVIPLADPGGHHTIEVVGFDFHGAEPFAVTLRQRSTGGAIEKIEHGTLCGN